ncbi:hypothetical protein SNE40_003257 [Patella caerulea]|uniref:Uncharacterized protein n=1 Tax=Patella caerulea TaxID=87958 RepID=A0AAN8Q022_PATCE
MYSVRQVKPIITLTENLLNRTIYGSRSSNILRDNIWTKVEDSQPSSFTKIGEALSEQGKPALEVEDRKPLEVSSSEMNVNASIRRGINQSGANSAANQYTTHNFKDLSVANQTMLYTL